MKKYIVITTINEKTEAIREFESFKRWHIVIIGDKNSKPIVSTPNTVFLSIENQEELGFELVDRCPYNHYTRKNIGYLYALENGADIIYDTDDDNFPYANWHLQDFRCNNQILSNHKFLNIYKYFTDLDAWPRGFPLDEIQKDDDKDITVVNTGEQSIGAWQGLADNEPDVDAIYRLVYGIRFKFEKKPAIYLPKGVYCPFNSQNTFWRKETMSLAYLPATISFRFTDILRGYVAQRIFWEKEMHLGFTEATVYQVRKEHDLMRDFKEEIECYLNIKRIVEILDAMKLTGHFLNDLLKIYEELVVQNFIPEAELPILKSWLSDLNHIHKGIEYGQN